MFDARLTCKAHIRVNQNPVQVGAKSATGAHADLLGAHMCVLYERGHARDAVQNEWGLARFGAVRPKNARTQGRKEIGENLEFG